MTGKIEFEYSFAHLRAAAYNGGQPCGATVMHDSELANLMSRHDLPQVAQVINDALRTERENRQRFRDELTPSEKSEFIGGRKIMHSPAKSKHLCATENLFNLLLNFVRHHSLGVAHTEKALVCLARNDYEPDISFFSNEKAVDFEPNTMQFPAPDFVVEVLSPTSESRDRGIKFDDYALHGVAEYWIIDCDGQSVEQYLLASEPDSETKRYKLACKQTNGEVTSVAVKGFCIPVAAIFDAQINRDTLRSLLG